MTVEVFLLNRDNLLMTARSLNTEGDFKKYHASAIMSSVGGQGTESPLSHLGPYCSRHGQDPWSPSSSCPSHVPVCTTL